MIKFSYFVLFSFFVFCVCYSLILLGEEIGNKQALPCQKVNNECHIKQVHACKSNNARNIIRVVV